MSRHTDADAPRVPDRRPHLPGQEVLPFLRCPAWQEAPPPPDESGTETAEDAEVLPDRPRLLLEVPLGRGRSELYSYSYLQPRREGRDLGPRLLELVRESDGWTLTIPELFDRLECPCEDFFQDGSCRHSRAVEATGLLRSPRLFPLRAGEVRR